MAGKLKLGQEQIFRPQAQTRLKYQIRFGSENNLRLANLLDSRNILESVLFHSSKYAKGAEHCRPGFEAQS